MSSDSSGVLVGKQEQDDVRLYSVTTLINALDKPAIGYWIGQTVADEAVRVAKSLTTRIDEDGPEAVSKWLSDARFRSPKGLKTAAQLGTDVHNAMEQLALTGNFPDVDDDVRPFLEPAAQWVSEFKPTFEAAEVTVYSPTYGYAGTLDSVMVIDGVRFLVDFKTSRKSKDNRGKPTTPYPEQVGLQLAAYRYADFAAAWRPRRYEYQKRRYYLLGAGEREAQVPVPEVDTCMVLHMTPDHCEAFPINADEAAFDAFLHCIEAYRWVNMTSRTIMGDPLEKA